MFLRQYKLYNNTYVIYIVEWHKEFKCIKLIKIIGIESRKIKLSEKNKSESTEYDTIEAHLETENKILFLH